MPKYLFGIGFPVLMGILNIIVHFSMGRNPKLENVHHFTSTIVKWMAGLIVLLFQPIILAMAMGRQIPIAMLTSSFVGLLMIIAGNYFPKNKTNSFIGFRTFWTNKTEKNWNKTNHLAGYLWIVSEMAFIIKGFF